jgi:hypothetical protein
MEASYGHEVQHYMELILSIGEPRLTKPEESNSYGKEEQPRLTPLARSPRVYLYVKESRVSSKLISYPQPVRGGVAMK